MRVRFLLVVASLFALACSPPPVDVPDAGGEPVAAGTLAGRVVRVEGAVRTPVAAATVSIVGAPFTTVSDSQGSYALSGIPAGTFELRAGTTSGLLGLRGDVVLGSTAGRDDVELVVGPVGRVKGTVRVGETPLPGAHVVLEPFAEAVTDTSGAYVLDDVPAGSFELVAGAQSPDGWVFSRGKAVDVHEGQDSTLDFELGSERVLEPVAAEGTVVVVGDRPATVRIRFGPEVIEANATGGFSDRARRLPPGIYTVLAEADGFTGVALDRVVVGSDSFHASVLWLHSDATACASSSSEDRDGDGVTDDAEPAACRCRSTGTTDTDDDGVCDDADYDADNDGIDDADDNCPALASPDRSDFDRDGLGDVCDDDQDGDGVVNSLDNCPGFEATDVTDADDDGVGDACDDCVQGDSQLDPDDDGFCGTNDNCPDVSNPDQADANGNTTGDACEGVAPETCTADLCPVQPAPFERARIVSITRVGTTDQRLALSRNGLVFRGREGSWSRERLPGYPLLNVDAAAASAPSTGCAYVVGEDGLFVTWGATGWVSHTLGFQDWVGVWGADATHAWAWNNTGLLSRWDGSGIVDESLVPGSPAGTVRALVGRGAEDAWATTADGLWKRDATGWTRAYTHPDATTVLDGLWIAPDGTPWVLVLRATRNASSPWSVAKLVDGALVQVGATLREGEPYAINGTANDDVWLLVSHGGSAWDAMYRWDGTAWSRPPGGNFTTSDDADLAGIAVFSRDEAYAAGIGGASWTWDGQRWEPSSGLRRLDPEALDGSSASDVWLLEVGGQPWHFDGTSWSPTDAPPGRLEFLASEGGETWAATTYLDVYQRVGGAWVKSPAFDPWNGATDPCPGNLTEVTALHVAAAGEVWLAARRPREGDCTSRDAIVFHRTGGTWTFRDPGFPAGQTIRAIVGPPSNVWLLGAHVARFASGTASFVDHEDPGLFWGYPSGAWADATQVWASFSDGSVVRRGPVDGWVSVPLDVPGATVSALAGDASGAVVGVGNNGSTVSYTSAGVATTLSRSLRVRFMKAWRAASGETFAAGYGVVARLVDGAWVRSFSGGEYSSFADVSFDTTGTATFGGSGGQLFTGSAAGLTRSFLPTDSEAGFVSRAGPANIWTTAGVDAFHFDGSGWTGFQAPAGGFLGDIWADVDGSALSYTGASLLRFSGGSVSTVECAGASASAWITALDGHPSGIAYAGNAAGQVCRWDRTSASWTLESTGVSARFSAIASGGGDEAWAAASGTLLHRTASGWASALPPQVASMNRFEPEDVAVSASGVVWVAGSRVTQDWNYLPLLLRYADGSWTELQVASAEGLDRIGLDGERPWVVDVSGVLLAPRAP